MSEIISSVTSAIGLVKKLKEVSDKIRNAEMKGIIADLSLELSDIKMKLADERDEKLRLQVRIRDLESPQADPCPKCRKRTWELEKSHPHFTLGSLGVNVRLYKCSDCGFTEEEMDKT